MGSELEPIDGCSHPEIMSYDDSLSSGVGSMRYTCTACKKSIVIPGTTIMTHSARDFSNIIEIAFGSAWGEQARRENAP